jgi:hypothetical protein
MTAVAIGAPAGDKIRFAALGTCKHALAHIIFVWPESGLPISQPINCTHFSIAELVFEGLLGVDANTISAAEKTHSLVCAKNDAGPDGRIAV